MNLQAKMIDKPNSDEIRILDFRDLVDKSQGYFLTILFSIHGNSNSLVKQLSERYSA